MRKPLVIHLGALALAVFAGACRQDMHDAPRVEPLEKSAWFDDERGSREFPEGTVARGRLRDDAHLYEGVVDGELADTWPFPITMEVMERGRERYDVFCSPCHDGAGTGQGVVVRRGFRRPPSLHEPRLREAAPGHFFDVVTNGFGVMQDYAAQVPPRDRWAIAAYVRALQLSQNAKLADVPEAHRAELDGGAPSGHGAASRTEGN